MAAVSARHKKTKLGSESAVRREIKKNVDSKALKTKRKATEDALPADSKRTKTATSRPKTSTTNKRSLGAGDKTSGRRDQQKSSKPNQAPQTKEVENEVAEGSIVPNEEVEDDDGDNTSDDESKALVRALDGDDDETESTNAANAVTATGKQMDVGAAAQAAKELVIQRTSGDDDASDERGVMYVGRLPNGFFEHEMRAYFSQFGTVTRLRVSRNKKTGASKGYAFIEFESAAVCEIAAKTMDHYLLFGHILRCKMISNDQVPPNLFKGANRRFKRVPWNKLAGRQLEQPASQATWSNRITKEERRRSARAKKLKEIGYEYEGPQLRALADVEKPAALPAPAVQQDGESRGEAAEQKEEGGQEDDETPPEPAGDVQQVTKTHDHSNSGKEETVASEEKAVKATGKSKKGRKAKQ